MSIKNTLFYRRNQEVKFDFTAEEIVRTGYLEQGEKHRFFAGDFEYKADSREKPQQCYAKIESTGKGISVRYFCFNIKGQKARELNFDFYVKRGEASENRIKEQKNMCFADRLSCHSFGQIISGSLSVAYEFLERSWN